MYTVLIVDDEQLMRSYLSSTISSLCPSFQVSGIACDGLEALELCKKQPFDLVITDIRMPEMDGLCLSKYLYETTPETKIIIISGYNEFDYAREAINYQVADYLLKPLNDDNLLEILVKVKTQLELSKNSVLSPFPVSLSTIADTELLSSLLASVLEENSTLISRYYEEVECRNLCFLSSYSTVLHLTIDELKLMLSQKNAYDVTSYHLKLNQLCQHFCKEHHLLSYYDSSGATLILLTNDTIGLLSENISSVYSEICHISSANQLPEVIATCGVFVTDMMEIPLSKITSFESLSLTLKNKKSPIFSDYPDIQKLFISELNTICHSIYTDYLSLSLDKMQADINLYCQLFRDDLSFASVLRYGSYLIKYIVQRSHIKTQYIQSAYQILTNDVDKLLVSHMPTADDSYRTVWNAVKCLVSAAHIPIISESDFIVEHAKEYILMHYNDPISLTMVADYIGVNSSYLSDLLHKQLGEPYSKYILRIRMEHAAKLLTANPNEKIYHVAEKVGFVSVKHFISVFKKYYGTTPSNYTKKPNDFLS